MKCSPKKMKVKKASALLFSAVLFLNASNLAAQNEKPNGGAALEPLCIPVPPEYKGAAPKLPIPNIEDFVAFRIASHMSKPEENIFFYAGLHQFLYTESGQKLLFVKKEIAQQFDYGKHSLKGGINNETHRVCFGHARQKVGSDGNPTGVYEASSFVALTKWEPQKAKEYAEGFFGPESITK